MVLCGLHMARGGLEEGCGLGVDEVDFVFEGVAEAGGLELAEFVHGAVVGAVEGVDLAEDFAEGVRAGGVALPCLAERGIGFVAFGEGSVKFGLAAVETAAEPVGIDHAIDVVALQRAFGLELVVVFSGELGESLGIFAGDDEGFGVHPVFERVETRGGLALGGAGASGFLSVEAIGLNLSRGCHGAYRVTGGLGGVRGVGAVSGWK